MKLVYRAMFGRAVPALLHDGFAHPSAKDMKEQAIPPYLAVHELHPRFAGLPLDALMAIYQPPGGA